MSHYIFLYIDLIGTFAFAISGALAGIKRRLDIFGVFVISFATACGGGVIRDVCIGQLPPAGLINIYYILAILAAVLLSVIAQKWLLEFNHPILFFDAIGLAFFAAFGAHKTFLVTQNIELAIILGTVSAVGGGAVRDLFLNKIPVVLTKEIYASAAIIGASIQVLGDSLTSNGIIFTWISIVICTTIRMLSLKYKWNLPAIKSIN